VLFTVFRRAAGSDCVVQAARFSRDLFAGLQDPTLHAWTLEDRLMDVLGRRARLRNQDGELEDPDALELAKTEVMHPGVRTRMIDALANVDENWLAENAVDVVRAEPNRWQEILVAFEIAGSDRVGEVAAKLVLAGLADADEVERWSVKGLDGRALKQVRTALVKARR
jgi:hypothetical protein